MSVLLKRVQMNIVVSTVFIAVTVGCGSSGPSKTSDTEEETGDNISDFDSNSDSDSDSDAELGSDDETTTETNSNEPENSDDESSDSEPADTTTDTENRSDSSCETTQSADATTVITRQGAVQGIASEGVTIFKAIPFAAPPVGDLRFSPPAPPACIDDVYIADEYGDPCPQLTGGDGEYQGNEDCLTLNIWTPAPLPSSESPKPVMVYIHGGGNGVGTASERENGLDLYDSTRLAIGADAVVVTIQYRIGALGWAVDPLAVAAGTPSGNFGLLDQIAALQWVKDNIAGFGGDPDSVMVFGESAGALNTCMLLVSPLADGLFQAAAMESGACPAYSTKMVLNTTETLIENTKCAEVEDPIACLRGLTPEQIVTAHPPVIKVGDLGGETVYQPNVDGYVIPDAPYTLLENGQYNHMPIIVGANSDETSRFVPQDMTEEMYRLKVTAAAGNQADEILELYPVDAFDSPADAYIRLTTDVKFVCSSRSIATYTSSSQTEPVHRYFFTQNSKSALMADWGAFHGLELLFIFDRILLPSDEEKYLSNAMITYWGGLAAGYDLETLDLPAWTPYDASLDNTLVLNGAEIAMQNHIRQTECDLWADVLAKLSR